MLSIFSCACWLFYVSFGESSVQVLCSFLKSHWLSSGKCQIEDGERILKHSKKNNYQLKILYPTKISSKKKVNWTVSRHTNAERMCHQHTCITRNAQRSPLSGRKYWMDLDLQKEMVIVSKYKDSFLII